MQKKPQRPSGIVLWECNTDINDVIFNELCLGNALVGARAGKSDIFEI